MIDTARLARRITWASSKQSFLTAWLLADRNLVDDCLRGYAYFRWADDVIDHVLSGRNARLQFIERQKSLVEQSYGGEWPADLSPEEVILADLIAHDRRTNDGLQSFICNFLAVLEFDAERKGRLINNDELRRYSDLLATAVIDGIQYFIGNSFTYPKPEIRCRAVVGAHVTHMLRDTLEDLSMGYINIPAEYIDEHGIDLYDMREEQLRCWVRERVRLARSCFREGKQYIESLKMLRCKLAGYWYCARFERILDAIERNGYCLQPAPGDTNEISAWLAMARLGLATIINHAAGRLWGSLPSVKSTIKSKAATSRHSIQIE